MYIAVAAEMVAEAVLLVGGKSLGTVRQRYASQKLRFVVGTFRNSCFSLMLRFVKVALVFTPVYCCYTRIARCRCSPLVPVVFVVGCCFVVLFVLLCVR